MKKIQPTITIGIPALNEEANITKLLHDVLAQNTSGFYIEKIVVVSDGSTDRTVERAKNLKNKKITVVTNSKRQGLSFVQNLIISKSKSDILILLNADIRIPDRKFIQKIAAPIANGAADLVAPSVAEAEPNTFFEKILHVSTKIKNVAYESYHDGNNVYTCRGVGRAFSKRLYEKMHFLASVGEDAFSYYFCITNEFVYHFEKSAKIVFRLPGNYSDHKKQSMRFFTSQELLKREFGKRLVTQGYKLNNRVLVASLLKNFIKNPVFTMLYILVFALLKIQAFFNLDQKDHWEISVSSKRI